jgi:glycosyltransferase involved in cell wall biosynthesis
MKILYLYTEIMGYNLPILERFVSEYGAEVEVVHWNQNKLTPFVPPAMAGVTFRERSTFTQTQLLVFATNFKPDLVYISGWQDRGYLSVVSDLKSQGAVVITGMDSQWTGSFRQQIVAKWINWLKKKKCFSYAWVPGPLQYEFARRIGFTKTDVLCNLLSGNSDVFAQAAASLQADKQAAYPKQFLYVGRFAESKGIDILIEAYKHYRSHYRGTWSLKCVGNGPLGQLLLEQSQADALGINVQAFTSQEVLLHIARESGAFILPSRYEPWGVVVHEFATAGLPLILSEHVGARPQFLIDGLNGYTFFNDSAEELAAKLHQIATLTNDRLMQMAKVSANLAQQVTPSLAAASFMSALGLKASRG